MGRDPVQEPKSEPDDIVNLDSDDDVPAAALLQHPAGDVLSPTPLAGPAVTATMIVVQPGAADLPLGLVVGPGGNGALLSNVSQGGVVTQATSSIVTLRQVPLAPEEAMETEEEGSSSDC